MGEIAGGDKALAGHATGPQALASRARPLDERHPCAQAGGDHRRHKPPGASAEHGEVVALAHAPAESIASTPPAWVAMMITSCSWLMSSQHLRMHRRPSNR